ncbi:hypothetical protein M3A49_27645 [Paraburkholderia sp. CNPSo 3076]|uniref:hypothetical protein n=1 Tax=unclassified Paraburkholderia TaxID=2615204 RepID=UPI0020B86770|nr:MULTISPECIES: hypothetical protein [unclassified Paraburkholderia]MCX5543216.1 hypothetical protein [Paraburkholderia sp. CNPSo 3076]
MQTIRCAIEGAWFVVLSVRHLNTASEFSKPEIPDTLASRRFIEHHLSSPVS